MAEAELLYTDPFDCRMAFVTMLESLTTSQNIVNKVATFAMDYKHFHEELYGCILDFILAQCPPLNRIAPLYVLDFICQASCKQRFDGYLSLLRKDLLNVFAAATEDQGVANIVHVKKVLNNWKNKRIFSESQLKESEQLLTSRDGNKNGDDKASRQSSTNITKNDIVKRIEEDRERHKRTREEVWMRPWDGTQEDGAVVNRDCIDDEEFCDAWETTSDLDSEDYEIMWREQCRLITST
ncbi:hypothetical protein HK102_005841 [Quaeritorhiza haematococci]|nr:hypothetical protein HK102_005841 [Quaeritorhiza haematococci]